MKVNIDDEDADDNNLISVADDSRLNLYLYDRSYTYNIYIYI